ncbi:PAAR domain-containing protein [Achromobacter spanius]|uniref:PAAR domain-containing protein n=1 Tax=Achromobacter spanius TaxID=217203 RepID=UPI003A8CA157
MKRCLRSTKAPPGFGAWAIEPWSSPLWRARPRVPIGAFSSSSPWRAARLGDPTSHGGVVLEAFENTNLNGKPVALNGMKTACGASLIAAGPKGNVQ